MTNAANLNPKISLDEAQKLFNEGKIVVIDVREPNEHATGVIKGAKLLPLQQLSSRIAEVPKDKPVYFICHTQNRSPRAANFLSESGWTNVSYVEGGMSDWNRRKLPTVKPQ